MNLRVGLDLGSTAIKMVMVNGDHVLCRLAAPTAPGQEKLARGLITRALSELGLPHDQSLTIAATGYGKKLFTGASHNLDEITANAAGMFHLSGGRAGTVINIGGQDLKVLYLDEGGGIADFKMNDKCAAGTGRFFELAARLLDVPLADFGELAAASEKDLELNSTCVVFAETEIVSLMAKGSPKEDIVRALNASVARRVAGMVGRHIPEGAIYLDGGPALNTALVSAVEDELMAEIQVLEDPQFTVAFGAAISCP